MSTHVNTTLSWIKTSRADRLHSIWYIMRRNNAPVLRTQNANTYSAVRLYCLPDPALAKTLDTGDQCCIDYFS